MCSAAKQCSHNGNYAVWDAAAQDCGLDAGQQDKGGTLNQDNSISEKSLRALQAQRVASNHV